MGGWEGEILEELTHEVQPVSNIKCDKERRKYKSAHLVYPLGMKFGIKSCCSLDRCRGI